jgi:hypothetical protein
MPEVDMKLQHSQGNKRGTLDLTILQAIYRIIFFCMSAYLCSMLLGCSVLAAGNRPAQDSDLEAIPVVSGVISPKDRWINDFSIYFYAINSIRTDSAYALLVLVPRHEVSQPAIPLGDHVFMLTGFVNDPGMEKPIHIGANTETRVVSSPRIIVLDFLIERLVHNSTNLRIRSDDGK